jgi:BlaI family transcriptional regulator, penicillinase repressor
MPKDTPAQSLVARLSRGLTTRRLSLDDDHLKNFLHMDSDSLSRRERELVDILYARGEASAREIADALADPEALDSIRVTLGILEKKGIVRHRVDGRRNVYRPCRPTDHARKTAWTRMTRTFFGGSASKALLTLLDMSGDRLDDEEFARLSAWVEARARTRKR